MDTITLSAVYPFYACYFVSKQKKFLSYQPIIISIEADDYYAIILMIFDSNKNLISWKELSGGLCAGPSEYEDRMEICPISYSIINNATDFTFISSTEIIPIIDSVVIQDSTLIDSLTYHLSINNNGIINKQLTDSVRFIKPYTNNEN